MIPERVSGNQWDDTTYVAAMEPKLQRKILIEEFTGASCAPCSTGHEVVKGLKGEYPGRIIVIAYHIFNFPQANPVPDVSATDFRTQKATDVGAFFGGIAGMPSAIIDRTARSGNFVLGRGEWITAVHERADTTSLMNMHLTSVFNAAKMEASVKLKIAYTEPFAERHLVTIAIVEDSVIDAQLTPKGVDTFYTHNYILRDIATSISGDLVLDSIGTKEPGRVFERSFEMPFKEGWKPEHCKLIAFVHSADPNKREVFQVVETKVQ